MYRSAIHPIPILSALTLFLSCGCDRDDPIAAYHAPKDTRPPATLPSQPSPAASAGVPHWDTPDGWQSLPAGAVDFAIAAFQAGDVRTTLTPVSMTGSSIAGNIQRWQAQLGQIRTPDADIPGLIQHVQAGKLGVNVVDLQSPDRARRMLGALFSHGGRLWTVKMFGPSDQVAAEKDRFLTFIRSIRFD